MKKILATSLVAAIIGISFSCNDHKKSDMPTKAIGVKVLKIDPSQINRILKYSGNILPYKTIKLGFMVAGKIEKVDVQNGQYVKAGQKIASLDPTDYQYAVDAAAAQYNDAKKELARLKSMYDKGSLTQSDYDKITSLYKEAEANYSYKKRQLSETNLYAAHSGYIVTEGIEPGEVIPQGMPLFGIVYTDMVYAEASIPEQEINNIKVNMEIEIYTPSLQKSYPGTIEQIEAVADPLARAFPVKAKVENPDKLLKPGMITYMKIPMAEIEDLIQIPSEAIITDANGHTYIYIVQKNDMVNKAKITCGRAIGSNVEVLKGLAQNDIIVIEGQQKLYQGAIIKIVD
ncbi:efflux RND transporter periplasmic adaptor subunit [Bacteroidota bacterium]